MLSLKHKTLIFQLLLFLIITVIFCSDLLAEQNPWHKALDSHGITIYLRRSNDSAVTGIKAEAIFNASLDVLSYPLEIVTTHPAWLKGNQGTTLLKTIDLIDGIFYSVFHFSGCRETFDMVLNSHKINNLKKNGEFIYQSTASDPALASSKEHKRIDAVKIEWIFKKMQPQKTHLTYKVEMNFSKIYCNGGSLPAEKIINNCYETFLGLKQFIKNKDLIEAAEKKQLISRMKDL